MAGALYNADNVVVGEAVLWIKPWSRDVPVEFLPDETDLFDPEPWETAGWTGAGATHEGFRANVETSTTTITIEEQSTPVSERVESKGITFEAALAEDTMESIQLSWGGGQIVTTAAAAGVAATKKMTLSDDVQYWVAVLEMRNFNGFARRIQVPKTSITGSGETSFRRAADKRTYPLRVASLCKPSEIEIVDVTAPATP